MEKERIRVGIGYDVHPLVSGRKLILAGVEIPHDRGLLGQSDADVASHAIMDALLGAASLGDLGSQFPPEEPEYEGISSLILLARVGELLKEKDFKVANIDVTIIAQRPRLASFIAEMRHCISQTLNINLAQVAVKATTTNGLGFIGREEGVAAQAVALIQEVR
jgi:2-C-methyl-D-erythritol 2,4-cyclodiphosphate synthase